MERTQTPTRLPSIIQGGMGVGVSDWRLARSVASRGYLGVVSGTGIDTVLARRLQLGDPDGVLREAFDAFPVREIADRFWNRYYIEGGKAPEAPFKAKPIFTYPMTPLVEEMVVLANFVEVFLAKQGHDGAVGINLLEKIQMGTLPSLLGAMLAGVDVVLMGAGIPREIPAALDHFAAGQVATLHLDVAGAPGDAVLATLDPERYLGDKPEIARPAFIAIVASASLAATLARRSTGRVDGFVVERFTAGGHNAPPRGGVQLDENNEPIYGPRDHPDLEAMRNIGLPFWLAGSFGAPGKLQEALDLGASGIQVGTAFAYCDESGMVRDLKSSVIGMSQRQQIRVATDPKASPTGFPFKVVSVDGTVSDQETYDARERVCDLGYLRQMYRSEDGKIGFRCPAEPAEDFIKKGGDLDDTDGRKCLCNALLATIGLGQVRKDGRAEPAIITSGDEVTVVAQFAGGAETYDAVAVLDRLLTPTA